MSKPLNQLDLFGLPTVAPAPTEPTISYTSLTGEIITVDSLDWLEDGWYWLEDDYCWESDEDDDGFFDKYPCSRYSIGVDENGDGLSVWLNDDMQEVEV